jgi:shikimate dehydrogenase
LQEGATEIRLINRTLSKAEAIAAEFGGPIQVLPWEDRHDALDGVVMAVNVTSQGMVGEAALDLRLDKLATTALAADIIYTPLETPFLAAAGERGNRTINGLGMLLHQGPPAWKRWFDVVPAVTAELREQMERSIAGD